MLTPGHDGVVTTNDAVMSLRDDLRAAVKRAMKERDRAALAVFRSALAAIDNAEAVPVDPSQRAGAIELSSGPGRTEAQRQLLSEHDIIDVVRREVVERRSAAARLSDTRTDVADQLNREADELQNMVDLAGSRLAEQRIRWDQRDRPT